MALYSFGNFSQGFPLVFSGPDQPNNNSILPPSRRASVGVIRFANRRPWEDPDVSVTSAMVARTNGVVLTTQVPCDNSNMSGVILGKPGSAHIYGKTPSSVLAHKEGRNTNIFGFVKLS